MIILIAKSTVISGKEQEFASIAGELAEKSRAEEGCIEYHLYQQEDQPQSFVFIEKWQNQQAIDQHNQSPHFVRLRPKMAELRTTSPEVSRYERIN